MGKRKKLILFIVEGLTDEHALYHIMRSFFPSFVVKFHVAHGDLMLEADKSENPVNLIKRVLAEERKRYGLTPSDIVAVFEVIDTDGAFIPAASVVYDKESNKAQFTEEQIITAHTLSFLRRNKKKKRNANILSYTKSLSEKTFYSLYYMSRNLEHALFNIKESISDNRKTTLSDKFGESIQSKEAFIKYLKNEGIFFEKNYDDSWSLINKDTESLKRHTNINLLFSDFDFLNNS